MKFIPTPRGKTEKQIRSEISKLDANINSCIEANLNETDWEHFSVSKDVLLWALGEIRTLPNQKLDVIAHTLSWATNENVVNPSIKSSYF